MAGGKTMVVSALVLLTGMAAALNVRAGTLQDFLGTFVVGRCQPEDGSPAGAATQTRLQIVQVGPAEVRVYDATDPRHEKHKMVFSHINGGEQITREKADRLCAVLKSDTTFDGISLRRLERRQEFADCGSTQTGSRIVANVLVLHDGKIIWRHRNDSDHSICWLERAQN